MSTADSVVIFVLVLLAIFVILFVTVTVRGGRKASQESQGRKSVQAGVRVRTEEPAVAKRLDPSVPNAEAGDPRGVDVGGNYSK